MKIVILSFLLALINVVFQLVLFVSRLGQEFYKSIGLFRLIGSIVRYNEGLGLEAIMIMVPISILIGLISAFLFFKIFKKDDTSSWKVRRIIFVFIGSIFADMVALIGFFIFKRIRMIG